MVYEILDNEIIIGRTKLEGGDPPMGFVFGAVAPTGNYSKDLNQKSLKIFGGDIPIKCNSITIEDLTEEMGETCVEVTVLIESAEEYEKHFKHHIEAYENQFK